jgi:hypothetical protein
MTTNMKFNADAFLKWQKMQKAYFQKTGQLEESDDRQPFQDLTNVQNLPQSSRTPISPYSTKNFTVPTQNTGSHTQ